MNEQDREILLDLLTKKAMFGLDDAEQVQLDEMDDGRVETEFRAFEITAAAINMASIPNDEPMPEHLFAKIAADADQHFAVQAPEAAAPWPPAKAIVVPEPDETRQGSMFGWLGWATAVAACIALAINIWFTRTQPVEQVGTTPPPVEIPQVLTPAEMREQMLRATSDMTKAEWAAGNVKEMKDITGDVVWSDQKQAGYMRFRGLPVNDPGKETYQLWIFDKTQDSATPIDGGTFDVSADGEVVVPINAKLKASDPSMFAITIEKPGGVVVSKREKIAALAKVETKPGQNT